MLQLPNKRNRGPPATSTAFSSSLGLLPEQFEGYRQCLKKQFQKFQTEYDVPSLTFSHYEDRWLDYEVGALWDVVNYLCGKPGNLLTLKAFVEEKPEGLHLKGLWANVLRTFGLIDPELPDRLGDLLTKPETQKIHMIQRIPQVLSHLDLSIPCPPGSVGSPAKKSWTRLMNT